MIVVTSLSLCSQSLSSRLYDKVSMDKYQSRRDEIFIEQRLPQKFPELRRSGIWGLFLSRHPLKHVAPTELKIRIGLVVSINIRLLRSWRLVAVVAALFLCGVFTLLS